VQEAAKHQITINAHEPIKDTGIRRTYPNMMSREGARGMEWNAWSEGNPPEHYELLPFTRLLSGPMDYTPGTFDITLENSKNHPNRKPWNGNDKGNSRVNTTLAKQLANWVVLYSPVQMASDLIEHYEGHPAFQFFRDFDADCDWSEALQGEPGEFIAVVRKAKDNYYLGATTNKEARTLQIPLSFLEKDKEYKAVIYADGEDADWENNPTSYRIEEKTVSASDVLEVIMAKGGGQAVSFLPIK
jgi:alpha-glucosidase